MDGDASSVKSDIMDDVVLVDKSDAASFASEKAHPAGTQQGEPGSSDLRKRTSAKSQEAETGPKVKGKKTVWFDDEKNTSKEAEPENKEDEKKGAMFGAHHSSSGTASRKRNESFFNLPLFTLENSPQNVAMYSFILSFIAAFSLLDFVSFIYGGYYKYYHEYYWMLDVVARLKLYANEVTPGIFVFIFGVLVTGLTKAAVYDTEYYKGDIDRYAAGPREDVDNGANRELSSVPVEKFPTNSNILTLLPYDFRIQFIWVAVGLLESLFKHVIYYRSAKTYYNVLFYPSQGGIIAGVLFSLLSGFCMLNYKYQFYNRGISMSISANRGFRYIWMIFTQLALSNLVTLFVVALYYRDLLALDLTSSDRPPPKHLAKIFASEKKFAQRTAALKLIRKLAAKGVSAKDYLTTKGLAIQVKPAVEGKEDTVQNSLKAREMAAEQENVHYLVENYKLSVFDLFLDGTHSPKNIALYSIFLGAVAGSGLILFLSTCGDEKYGTLCYLGIYLVMMANFHLWEYVSTAMYHITANLTNFVLDHSSEYTIAFVSSVAEFIIEVILFPGLKSSPTFTSLRYLGLVVAIGSQFLRTLAMITAGSNFDHIIQQTKADEHILVKTGIYAYLRHPSYTGFFYFSVGLQMLLLNPVCFVGFTIALQRFFTERIQYEEETLVEFFGDEYVQYRKESGVYIPLIN